MVEVPASLGHLIAVNDKFAVLLCVSTRCRHALTVGGIGEHLRKSHLEGLRVRREAKKFALVLAESDARFLRDHRVVELPINGSPPQPILPVVEGFSCRFCPFLTISRDKIRKHANKDHSTLCEKDERICTRVSMQSWFGWKRERYWVVGDVTNGLGEAANGQGEAANGQGKATRGLDDAMIGSGEATTTGFGEATRGLGDATTGSGEATRALGEATRELGDATMGLGDATTGSGEATRALGEATTGLGDAANELDGIKEDVQRWRDEAMERRLKLMTTPLVFELDSWLNYKICRLLNVQVRRRSYERV